MHVCVCVPVFPAHPATAIVIALTDNGLSCFITIIFSYNYITAKTIAAAAGASDCATLRTTNTTTTTTLYQ